MRMNHSDQLPGAVEEKRLHFGANDPASKGHQRDAKHGKQGSYIERYAKDGADVDVTPGEEDAARKQGGFTEAEADGIIDSRERKE